MGITDLYSVFNNTKKTFLNVDSDVIDYIVERHSPPLDPNYRSDSNRALTTVRQRAQTSFDWILNLLIFMNI